MARNRSEHFEQTDLKQIIDQTMVLLERELQKYRIAVEMDLGENIPEVSAIGNQIQQVLMNLLINARQAMPEGGRLLISLQHDQESNSAHLTIRDFGSGMDAETMQKIFEPYFSTKEGPDESGKGGTGLGLAACKNIIEAHGGKIRVESAIGQGTKFVIKLPVDRQKSPVKAARGIAGAISHMNVGTSAMQQS
jgi:signal transduction histidine kinase